MSSINIASHGRVGKVSAISIGSFGRLYRATISKIVTLTIAEVMNLVSVVKTVLNMESRFE